MTSLFSSKPNVEIEFDTSTVDQIDSNENSASVSEFVPDIRCSVKGQPQVQYQDLKDRAGEGSPSPTPTPEPTATPTPTTTPTPSPTPSGAGIECEANQAVVGITGASDGKSLTRIGLLCAPIDAGGVSDVLITGPSVGGASGDAFTFNCSSGKVLGRVAGDNGTATDSTVTAGHRYQCANPTGGGGSGMSSTYGGTGNTPFDLGCASADQYVYGLDIGQNDAGTATSFTLGVKCRSIP